MKRRRSYLAIALAVALGLVTAGLVWTYTQQVQKQVQESKKNLVPVVVAARDIPVRTKITKDMLAIKQVNEDARLDAALTSIDQGVGQITRLPIAAGEQILPSKFTSKRAESGLSYMVPPGKRAVSVKVDEIIGAGGNLLPGDHVDVIGVFDAKTLGKDQALYVLKDVEVLAVAQTLEGEETVATSGAMDRLIPVGTTAKPAETPTAAAVKPQPQAKTVTLAVSPEEAQRLVLASERGVLRLALRGVSEVLTPDLPPATLSTIQSPLQPPAAQITAVSISPTNAKAGDVLKVEITVKNTGTTPLKTQGPDPEFTYVQGQTFHSQNFPSKEGVYRVGINFDGQAAAPFPYRWGLGGELPPGSSTTIVGYVKLTYDMKPTNFWAGLIKEPAEIVQDNVGTTLVTVIPANTAVISVDVANVRSGPSIDASIIAKLEYGTQVPILGQQADWYKVQLPDGRQGFIAAGWIVQPNGSPNNAGNQAGGQVTGATTNQTRR